MKLQKHQIARFRKFIFAWWRIHRRDLPWRHTHDPYRILVSEIMLQQTQVLRVLAKYREFIEQYPTVSALSRATTADVLRIWKGMGYNRRALYLKRAAETIVAEHDVKFPDNEHSLVKLPGLGKYTARAILVFAYKQDTAAVDTNIRQIITYHFFEGRPQKESVIQSVADQLLPKGKSWEWHQALMDYGALELKKFKRPMRRGGAVARFKDSDRFFRGRILDMLRIKDMEESAIIDEFTSAYDRSQAFIESILVSLEKDALIERFEGIVRLPG